MPHPSKKPALETDVFTGANGQKPFNHVDDETTTVLQNVPRGVRKSVTDGYRIPPSPLPLSLPLAPPRPADHTLPHFRSHAEDVLYSLDLISPALIRRNELKPLYETHTRDPDAGPRFPLPTFPGVSGERKRRMHRETSPSSSAGNSPESSPPPQAHAGLDAQGDVDMDMPREIKPRPKRTMARNVQSQPVGTFMFRGGTYAPPPAEEREREGESDMMVEEEGDEAWRKMDFSAYAKRVPE